MLTVKDYNVKLQRLRSTRKMTSTMKLVSANKRRKAQDLHRRAEGFAAGLTSAVAAFASTADWEPHPLLVPRTRVQRVRVLVLSSDMGLCGGFNNSLLRGLQDWIAERTARGIQVTVSVCGRRGWLFARHRLTVRTVFADVVRSPSFLVVGRIGRDLRSGFLDAECDEVYVAANVPTGALGFRPTVARFLPLELPSGPVSDGGRLAEPAAPAVREHLLPLWSDARLFALLTGSVAAEHGARMLAMDSSSSNAARLIEEYTLLRNRARQAAITRELNEIVSGAEALA
jgi:F-type H+-transporting ATPase subunit gamma